MAGKQIEIARQEGKEFRSVRLAVEDDGSIKMDGQDIGPSIAEIAGDNEYEFWAVVPKDCVTKLAFELLLEKFAGRLDAVEAFRAWCKAHDVACEFGNWF